MVLLSWLFVRAVEDESRSMQGHRFPIVRKAGESRIVTTHFSPDAVMENRFGEC